MNVIEQKALKFRVRSCAMHTYVLCAAQDLTPILILLQKHFESDRCKLPKRGLSGQWNSQPRRDSSHGKPRQVQRSLASLSSYHDSRARSHPFSLTLSGRLLSRASITYVEARPSHALGSPYLPFTTRGESIAECCSRVRVPFRELHFTQMVAKLASA